MVRDLVRRELSPEKAIEFALWAFGDQYEDLFNDEFRLVWNFRHEDKLKLHGNGRPDVDLPKMIEIWKRETKQEA
jgi:hypothetical protein